MLAKNWIVGARTTWHCVVAIIFLCTKEAQGTYLPLPSPRTVVVSATYTSPRCQDKYSCSANSEKDVQECSCHPECSLFDSCCADVRPSNWVQLKLPQDSFTCAAVSDLTGKIGGTVGDVSFLYLISNCPSSFSDSAFTGLCQLPLDQMNNGTLSLPVTDPSTGLSYRNIFCAFCNSKKIVDVTSWKPKKYCSREIGSFAEASVLSNIANSSLCTIAYDPPELTVRVPDCRTSLVESCPPGSAADLSVQCPSEPTAYVYNPSSMTVYRNWKCSLCHELSGSPLECTAKIPVEDITSAPTITVPVSITPNYHCPKALTFSMSSQEQEAWRSVCPAIRAVSKCSKSKKGSLSGAR